MSDSIDIVEHFHGVYLLYCTNPKYLGRIYIGYTIDPNRRIEQHNAGKKAGGAWKTSKKGPWVMVMIIHGFPNDIAALRFEWAWQHPLASRRLQHLPKKQTKEKVYDYYLRILSEMLQIGPWKRLPLTIRWLNEEFAKDLQKSPPLHMSICYGPVISKKLTNSKNNNNNNSSDSEPIITQCFCCNELLLVDNEANDLLTCLNPNCNGIYHILCLSKCFLKIGDYVPIDGQCPKCKMNYLWGDLIRKYKGCYNHLDLKIQIDNDNADLFYNSD